MSGTSTRVALITGAASGLGLATARRLAADGFRIMAADLRHGAALEALALLPGEGHAAFEIDVGDEASVRSLFHAVESEHGPVTAYLNFAGILSTRPAGGRTSILELESDEWSKVMHINAGGSFFGVSEMARRRTAEPVEHGRIVLLASLAGQIGGLQAGAAYSASKAAVIALAKVAARELGPLGITVNVIAPGPIDTPMLRATVPEAERANFSYGSLDHVPLRRVGNPDEIAGAASFLVSPEGGYTTGATIDINGGLSMR
jgi:3-oxoacyl-[acyl-carrier protein] reductase